MLHSITEGFKNISRSFWLSFTAISVLFVSLFSVSIVTTLQTAVGVLLSQVDQQLDIKFYLNNSVDENDIPEIQMDIGSISGVSKVKFISKEEAKNNPKNTRSITDNAKELQEETGENPFLNSFSVLPNSSEEYKSVYDALHDDKFSNIVNVKDSGNEKDIVGDVLFVEGVQKAYWWINLVSLILVLIFALISTLVISNILRISIYSSKEEIAILRLVGGTDSYIQSPFLFQALFYTFVAAVMLMAIAVPSWEFSTPFLSNFVRGDNITLDINEIRWKIYGALGLVILSAFVISYTVSYLSTKKYMKL